MTVTSEDFIDQLKVHDVDTHVLEPPDLWTARMSKKWGDVVPHIVRVNEKDVWFSGDVRIGTAIGGQAQAGWTAPYPDAPYRYEEAPAGAWQADARLAWMDANGVYSQVLYPNMIAFHTARNGSAFRRLVSARFRSTWNRNTGDSSPADPPWT